MFHLFSGIQAVPDVLTFCLNREYVISDFSDYKYDFDFTVVDNLLKTPHVVIARASSYDKMVGETGCFCTDYDFFYDVYRHAHERPTIYTSAEALATIVCKTLRLIFKNMPSDVAYITYKLAVDKFTVKYAYLEQITRGTNLISAENVLKQGIKRLTKEQFVSMYNNCSFTGDEKKISEFRELILDEISTEFQIANNLLGNTRFDQILNRQLKNVAADHIRAFCQEYSEIEIFNVYKDRDFERDVESLVNNDNVISLYRNEDLEGPFRVTVGHKRMLDDVIQSNKTKKLDKFNSFAIAAEKAVDYYQQHIDTYHWDLERRVVDNWSGEYTDFMWLCEIVKDQYSVSEILQRLLDIRHRGYAADLLYFYSSRDNINIFLLFYIYSLYDNDKQSLEHFKL